MTRREDGGFPMPGKPLTEMTREELDAVRRQLNRERRELDRPRRERKLRAGLAKPRNAAEWKIFASDHLQRDTEPPEPA